jgi:hypothetical protein
MCISLHYYSYVCFKLIFLYFKFFLDDFDRVKLILTSFVVKFLTGISIFYLTTLFFLEKKITLKKSKFFLWVWKKLLFFFWGKKQVT